MIVFIFHIYIYIYKCYHIFHHEVFKNKGIVPVLYTYCSFLVSVFCTEFSKHTFHERYQIILVRIITIHVQYFTNYICT